MDLLKLSASRLKTYSSCPRKYWYTYENEKIPPHPSAFMGRAVHRTVELGHNTLKAGEPLPEPVTAFSKFWLEETAEFEGQIDHKLYTDGVKIIEKYDFTRRTPEHIELEFKLPFPNKDEALCVIHGFIDQFYEWGLVDLKTGKRKPAALLLNNDLQFILYKWAFKELTGEEPKRVIWHHMRTGEDLDFEIADRLDRAKRVVERIVHSYNFNSWDRSIGEACMFCSHQDSCLGSGKYVSLCT